MTRRDEAGAVAAHRIAVTAEPAQIDGTQISFAIPFPGYSVLTRTRLAATVVVIAACSSDTANSPTSGTVTQWIVDQIVLPTSAPQASDFAYDLNGDGTPDNQLGSVLATLVSSGLDIQAGTDAGIDDGDIVQLIQFQSDDAALTADAAARATWYVGMPTAGFTIDPHQIDGAYEASAFTGPLSGSDYTSRNPATTTQPIAAFVPLRLFASTPIIYLPLNGAHVEWSFNGTTGIVSGRIRGSIRQEDISNLLVPGFADAFNTLIQADPASGTAETLLDLFDLGGCASAVADDGIIAVCEVATNGLMQSLLAPDVQIYNGSGNYQPSAANANPNALSFGIGFTAVRTTF